MISLFLGLTFVNLLGLAAAAVLGFVSVDRKDLAHWHLLAGVLATIACIGVHCIVFTYFIATAKWIQHAIAVKNLDPLLAAPTRSFKAQAFPAAIGAMAIVFATAILGAIVDNYAVDSTYHLLLAMCALALNIIVAAIEFRAISRNGQLIDDILAKINPPA